MQTVTTVGFGDFPAVSNIEKLYAIVWMVIGGTYYSFMISNLQGVATEKSNKSSLKSKLNTLNLFANETDLPSEIYSKLKRLFFIDKNNQDFIIFYY